MSMWKKESLRQSFARIGLRQTIADMEINANLHMAIMNCKPKKILSLKTTSLKSVKSFTHPFIALTVKGACLYMTKGLNLR